MNRKPAVHVLEVPGIDLDYRPRDYFWALDTNVLLPSGISGEARRKLFRARIEAGSTVHDGLDAELLDKAMREAWGRLDPYNMGGEYLPPLRKGEVEIARISLASVTADQISVRARRVRERIRYRIVDEYSFKSQLVVAYESHFGTHVPLEPMRILQPADLVALIQKALATNTPMAETGLGWAERYANETGYSPRGCYIVDESATPAKLPSGEWLH
jgi:hypothetical protein